jgi:hypothetical protein
MAKFDQRVEELLAKHPSLTKEEAIKIVTEKNERKKIKRAKKTERSRSPKVDNDVIIPDHE